MMRALLPLIFLFTLALPAAAQESGPDIVKDSVYFTLDDGIMTQEEMIEEARYVHGQCTRHIYQRLYFDCACIAGAFLGEREKRGPMALQQEILTELYRTGGQKAKCGNGPEIAGAVYNDCIVFSSSFRRLETNNEDYCRCVGNRVSRNFTDYPYLRTDYIARLRVNALVSCDTDFPMTRENF